MLSSSATATIVGRRENPASRSASWSRASRTMSSDGTVRSYAAMRRRLYLMRHGAVSYFRDDGTPVDPDAVVLNEEGRAQAAAARDLLAQVEFDRVLTSGLRRTNETAEIVAQSHKAEPWPEL